MVVVAAAAAVAAAEAAGPRRGLKLDQDAASPSQNQSRGSKAMKNHEQQIDSGTSRL